MVTLLAATELAQESLEIAFALIFVVITGIENTRKTAELLTL